MRYRAGNAAYKQKHYAEAKTAYEDAFRLKQTFDIAANLGFAEFKLEMWRDAATHLSFALRNWAPTGKAESRASAVKYLGVAKERIATLAITVASGAEVMIDGKRAGTAPVEERFVDPGTHTVGAKRDGYNPIEQAVTAEKGKTLQVALSLVATAPPPPEVSATPVPSGFRASYPNRAHRDEKRQSLRRRDKGQTARCSSGAGARRARLSSWVRSSRGWRRARRDPAANERAAISQRPAGQRRAARLRAAKGSAT